MINETFDIVLTSNSPGELYSLVRPTIQALNKLMPGARLILVIPPCQFASGREIEVARSFKELYEIILPEEFRAWILKNEAPKGIKFSKKGIVLFMGGDLLNAVILSRKLGYRACAYTMDKVQWKKSFLKFFVPDERIAAIARKKKVSPASIRIVGDLMVDGIKATLSPEFFGLDSEKPVITFLPGSRTSHTGFLAPFFLKAAEIINSKMPDVQFVFGLSPYTNFLKIEEMITYGKADEIDKKYGSFGKLIFENNRKYLITEKGTRVLLVDRAPYDAMNIADLIITIPGTNTAEAAALGKPMLVTVPFNKPDVYIFEGLTGILGNTPFIGKYIKQSAIYVLNKLVKYAALPNIKADSLAAPEMRGILEAEDIAQKAIEMLRDNGKLLEMGSRLKNIMGQGGAAEKIAEEIQSIMLRLVSNSETCE